MRAQVSQPTVIQDIENLRVVDSALTDIGICKIRLVISAYAPEVAGVGKKYWTLLGEGGSVECNSREEVERFLLALRDLIEGCGR